MKKILFTIVIILCSFSVVQAQDEKSENENLLVQLQDGAKPKIIVDGKVFDFPIELIDQSKIASMFVVKGKEAIKKYDAPNGVILIVTKEADRFKFPKIQLKEDKKLGAKNGPKIIVDGKEVDKKILDKISPNTIEKMEIVKGKKAKDTYNAPNGVIIITTKKM
ncbi:hypothetical protein [Polaribacter sp.]|uniref:hypothetical protein n=1 Tax=Polaribacter sp. TaxID=1920175 RepID=UPI003F6C8107